MASRRVAREAPAFSGSAVDKLVIQRRPYRLTRSLKPQELRYVALEEHFWRRLQPEAA